MKQAADIIQDCALPGGLYNKIEFLQIIESMTLDEFSKFCKEVLLLTEHYDRSINVSVCDSLDFIEQHPGMFYKFRKIDPDGDIHFEMIDQATKEFSSYCL